jgi:transcriptional regulator with XRE-family HTH domain
MEQKIEAIISQNLVELRKSRNLKQSELSEAVGYSDKTISRWENGTSTPDIATLVNLAKFYGISVEDIITEGAINKATEEAKKQDKERAANDAAMIVLGAITVWLLAAVIYVGLVMAQGMYVWEVFLWAVPLSSIMAYLTTRKRYKSHKWMNFLLLSFTIIGLAVAAYFQFIYWNFWPVFILIIPLEAMSAVSIFFRKHTDDKKKKRKNKNVTSATDGDTYKVTESSDATGADTTTEK